MKVLQDGDSFNPFELLREDGILRIKVPFHIEQISDGRVSIRGKFWNDMQETTMAPGDTLELACSLSLKDVSFDELQEEYNATE